MKKREVIRILRVLLKTLVALAAAANLIALFVFQYKMPSWLRKTEAAPETIEETDVFPTAAPDVSSSSGEYLSVPLVPVNYSGEADLEGMIMSDVFLMGGDGQPVDDTVITYEILPGEEAQKKTVRYTVEAEDGQLLTKDRVMNLTVRYTGPKITLLSVLPGIDPGFADDYASLLGDKGVIYADDGFGNDVTDQVRAEFEGLSDEEPSGTMTLYLENQIHDTAEMELEVRVKDYSGIVLALTDYRITITEGDDFDPYDYVAYAHDVDGSDMMNRLQLSDHVDADTPGEYYVVYWVWNDEHTAHSPDRYMYVTVEERPEEAVETDEAP